MNTDKPDSGFSIDLGDLTSLDQNLQLSLDVRELSLISGISDSAVNQESLLTKNSVNAELRSVRYSRLFFDWDFRPPECDKYTLFQVYFDTDFSSVEFDFLRDRFRDFSRVFLTRDFLQAIRPLGDSNANVTAPRNRTLPISNNNPPEARFTEGTIFYVIFAGRMTSYFPECQDEDTKAFPYPRYIPIFARRYEKPQEANGFWETAWAPIIRLNDTNTCEINFNATAIRDGGFNSASWAGTIMHELMHNGGWEHPNGYQDRSQYMLAVEDALRGLA
jgi:hypothetical protein